jgi:hypothetical protein
VIVELDGNDGRRRAGHDVGRRRDETNTDTRHDERGRNDGERSHAGPMMS